jgi:hypothetical protein
VSFDPAYLFSPLEILFPPTFEQPKYVYHFMSMEICTLKRTKTKVPGRMTLNSHTPMQARYLCTVTRPRVVLGSLPYFSTLSFLILQYPPILYNPFTRGHPSPLISLILFSDMTRNLLPHPKSSIWSQHVCKLSPTLSPTKSKLPHKKKRFSNSSSKFLRRGP